MEYSKFKENVIGAGLTINDFSRLLKSSPKSISNYSKTGSVPKHLAIISELIREMKRNNTEFIHVFGDIEIKAFQKRGKNQFVKK